MHLNLNEDIPEKMNEWWGYKHTSGTYHIKRYFDYKDIQEARESPFCEIIKGPFYAENREYALIELEKLIN